MMPTFEIYPSEQMRLLGDGLPEWRWRLRAGNGEIVAAGESYTRREDAERAVERLRELAATATVEVLG